MTEFIIWPHKSGKSRAILARMAEDPNLVMVCVDERTAVAYRRDTHHHGIAPERFISIDEAMDPFTLMKNRARGTRYAVDNVEIILSGLLNAPVAYIAGTPMARAEPDDEAQNPLHRAKAWPKGHVPQMGRQEDAEAPEPAVHQFWTRNTDGAEFIIRSVVRLRDRIIVTKQRTDRGMGRDGDYDERITMKEFLKRYTYARTASTEHWAVPQMG